MVADGDTQLWSEVCLNDWYVCSDRCSSICVMIHWGSMIVSQMQFQSANSQPQSRPTTPVSLLQTAAPLTELFLQLHVYIQSDRLVLKVVHGQPSQMFATALVTSHVHTIIDHLCVYGVPRRTKSIPPASSV